jgi:hypothetical protein
MSTISLHQRDYSDALCKRFAYLASTYLDTPEQARKAEAHVPIENLFRLLQMFRYESFEDSARPGILELRALAPRDLHTAERPWHHRIEAALSAALLDVFGSNASKDAAIEEIQSSLRWLATNGEPPSQEIRHRSKIFMGKLISALD